MKGAMITEVDCNVEISKEQTMMFGEANAKPPLPFYNLNALFEHTPILKENGIVFKTDKGKVRTKQKNSSVGICIKQV